MINNLNEPRNGSMNISEFAKPVTAKSLNESLAKRFGQRIRLENYSLAQLQDARNKLRTKLSQIEVSESFDTVLDNDNYQKSKLMLDILNAEISERGDIEQDSLQERTLREGAEDQAEIVMATKDMVDRITGWMEDTAQMQTESMLELADSIRDEMGAETSDQFIQAVKPGLENLYAALEQSRQALSSAVGLLTGEQMPATGLGAEDEMGDDAGMEPTVDQENMPPSDEFGAARPAAGGSEPAGRPARESVDPRKLGKVLASSKKK